MESPPLTMIQQEIKWEKIIHFVIIAGDKLSPTEKNREGMFYNNSKYEAIEWMWD